MRTPHSMLVSMPAGNVGAADQSRIWSRRPRAWRGGKGRKDVGRGARSIPLKGWLDAPRGDQHARYSARRYGLGTALPGSIEHRLPLTAPCGTIYPRPSEPRVKRMTEQLQVGARVRVPWGLEDDVEGTVIEVWGDTPRSRSRRAASR
jgi:hypothetical protein